MKAKLLWILFLVIAACAVMAVVGLWLRKAGGPRAPDFRLVERDGRTVTRRDLIGQVWVADFVFTRCQLTCPVMTSAMYDVASRHPSVRFVSFSVDPRNDTPENLRKWVSTMGVGRPGWDWLTGQSDEEMQRIARGFLLRLGKEGDARMEILHDEKFVLVDRYGRIRGYYPMVDEKLARRADVMKVLEDHLQRLLAEPALPISKLPTLNAGLNAASAVLLLVGLAFIKARRVGAHKACMLGALGTSTLFLASYLTAHYFLGSMPYTGQGWTRPVYFGILLTHTILAALIVPLAGVTLYRAFREDFERHRRIARWTLPLWLYVSVTGVIIYFMLYGSQK